MAIDFSTYIGQIRALINDVNEEDFEFQDNQLQAYYDMSFENIVQASILALRALVAKYTATSGDEYKLDTIAFNEGKSKASNFLSLLKNLEDSVKDGTNPLLVGVPRTYGFYVADIKENNERVIDGEIIPRKTTDNENNLINLKQQYGVYYQG